ncbi:helix-turn-helix transcriptional regulator [Streptomyces sp. HNM0575]|uniref:helix-turn-helix domain-containing protein n=1 Tax=Streptomyces sp. HNM0575 TaxID=2716338 RepID=UPI00145F5720|nr:helix-turn-helix transcriptional regulator [Streptomyces sp. HNM0575]NLU75663.1 helix-turn-helix transcriptional regulator [Streptomyces sp. HNM0575]
MAALDDEHTGARIADQRKLAGLTQRGLAALIPYSYSLLRHVETGHKNASPDLVSAVARALRIDVTALTGQPYVTELQQDRLAELIRPIRESLDLYDLGDDPDLTVRTVGELTADADELCRRVRATRLNAAARALPGLIAELTTAAYRTPSSGLWRALGSTYRTAHDIATKLGFFDLSTIALDRMAWAADRASDPLLAAVRQYMRALVYFREGEHTIGLRLINRGHDVMAQAEESTASLAVAGQLHLGTTVIAARARDMDAVVTHLAEAGRHAERTGEAGHVHWLSFGPANVAAHEVSANVELRRYGKALEKARKVQLPRDWPLSRRAHVYIDRARSEMETGRTDAALGSLVEARRMAPQQTRYHPGARETIKGLVHQRRSTPNTLDNMAAWIGL